VRLDVDFEKGTADLNGIKGSIDLTAAPPAVHWKLKVIGPHMLTRHEAGTKPYVSLADDKFRANFECAPAE
jgi:hypothetical protein